MDKSVDWEGESEWGLGLIYYVWNLKQGYDTKHHVSSSGRYRSWPLFCFLGHTDIWDCTLNNCRALSYIYRNRHFLSHLFVC